MTISEMAVAKLEQWLGEAGDMAAEEQKKAAFPEGRCYWEGKERAFGQCLRLVADIRRGADPFAPKKNLNQP